MSLYDIELCAACRHPRHEHRDVNRKKNLQKCKGWNKAAKKSCHCTCFVPAQDTLSNLMAELRSMSDEVITNRETHNASGPAGIG